MWMKLAAKTVLDQQEGILVHGSVWSHTLRRRMDHAWVELPTGTPIEDEYGDADVLTSPAVFDPTLKKKLRLLPKPVYDAFAQAREASRYSVEEARTMVLRTRTWGPW